MRALLPFSDGLDVCDLNSSQEAQHPAHCPECRPRHLVHMEHILELASPPCETSGRGRHEARNRWPNHEQRPWRQHHGAHGGPKNTRRFDEFDEGGRDKRRNLAGTSSRTTFLLGTVVLCSCGLCVWACVRLVKSRGCCRRLKLADTNHRCIVREAAVCCNLYSSASRIGRIVHGRSSANTRLL